MEQSEKQIIEQLKMHIPEKIEELVEILAFGEKMKAEGEKKKVEFWKTHKREDFLGLLLQYQNLEKNFIKGLSSEEQKIFDETEGVVREKFLEEYLDGRIIYGGNVENLSIGKTMDQDEEIDWLRRRGDLEGLEKSLSTMKDQLKPGIKMNLLKSKIGVGGAEILAKYLKNYLQVCMSINLKMSKLGDEGVKILAEYWRNSLQFGMLINLRNNEIGDEGAKAISRMNLKKGVSLNLSNNQIGDEGIEAIARNMKLKEGVSIDLSVNGFGDEGAKAIAENLELQEGVILDLCDNKIGDEGAKSIMENMELKNGVKIDLSENHISEKMKQKLKIWYQNRLDLGIKCEVIIDDVVL